MLSSRVGKGRVGWRSGSKKGRVGSGSKNEVDPRVKKAGRLVEVVRFVL